MNMTFDQYINNPMGRKNMVFSSREMYRDLYRDKLDKLYVRETGEMKYTCYKGNDMYLLHMKVPSEVVPNFYYDSVILFHTDNPAVRTSKTLKDYYVKFYSNDPSFVFTFTYAMAKNDMFIHDLDAKMSKLALKNIAKERNPSASVGYVKSIYFTYLIMRNRNLFEKIIFEADIQKYSKKKLLGEVEHADDKIEKRQRLAEEISKAKRISKAKNINKEKDDSTNINTKSVKSVGGVKVTSAKKNTINTVKKTKRR